MCRQRANAGPVHMNVKNLSVSRVYISLALQMRMSWLTQLAAGRARATQASPSSMTPERYWTPLLRA